VAFPYIIGDGAFSNGYLVLAAIGLLAIPLAIWLLPPPSESAARHISSTGATRTSLLIPALCGIALIGASDYGMWAFIEQIGSRAGLSPEGIGRALATATLAGSICAGLAAWIGTRFGRLLPLIASCCVMVVAAAVLAASSRVGTFSVVVNIWSVAVFLGLTYAMGAVAAADSSGRWSAAAAGARAVGGALGPLAIGLAAGRSGFPAAGLMVSMWCGVALALSVPLALQLGRVAVNSVAPDARDQPATP
jgi:hypothetical protein